MTDLTPDTLPHGWRRYKRRRCRCDICRDGWASYNRKLKVVRAAKLREGLVEVEHGKESTYGNYRCRCEACRVAAHDGYLRARDSYRVPS